MVYNGQSIRDNGDSYQLGNGVVLHIPVVSTDDQLTFVYHSETYGKFTYGSGDTESTGNDDTYSPTAADVAQGFVAIAATTEGNSYLKSITVTQKSFVSVTIGTTEWVTFSYTAPVDFTNLSGVVSAYTVHELHRIAGFAAFPDFVGKAFGAAMEVIGAIVDGELRLLAVEGELASHDPSGDSAGNLAGAGAVGEIRQGIGVADHHVGNLAVPVGNADRDDGSADIGEHHTGAALVLQGPFEDFFSVRGRTPKLFDGFHMLVD